MLNSRINRVHTIIKWAPRILAVLYIIFISIFAIDVFSKRSSFLETIIILTMYLIPSIILIIITIIAWKKELIGSIGFILIGIRLTLRFNTLQNLNRFLIISAPLFLIGFLFLLSKYFKNKN